MAGLFFWGIGRVPLAQAIALTFIAPLIALLLAAMFLNEQIGPRSIAGSVMAFARRARDRVRAGARRPRRRTPCSAAQRSSARRSATPINIVLMRHQSLAAKPLEINFFQSLTVLVLVAGADAVPRLSRLAGRHGRYGSASRRVMSTAGGLLFSWAYARAEASYLAVTEYSAFLWAAALGWLIFSEPVSLYTAAGAALIVGGCFVAARSKIDAPGEVEVVT